MSTATFTAFVMAVDRVERRLKRVATALDQAGIRYAVIGGNAVATWVARKNRSATRATKDVDLLVDRSDAGRVTSTLESLGFQKHDLRRLVLFIDPEEPDRRSGVHLVWAGERVRPSYTHAAPQLAEAVRDPEDFWVIDLPALVRMKLTSFRDIDRVHIADMLGVGLIDSAVRSALPADLIERLDTIEDSLED